MKILLMTALCAMATLPAAATSVRHIAVWDCVIENVGDPENMAYAHRAESMFYGNSNHSIYFRETLPSPGYTTKIESMLKGEGQSYYGIQFDVEWIAPEGMAATVMGEGEYNLTVPAGVESFAVELKKSFNYGPEKIGCYKSQE